MKKFLSFVMMLSLLFSSAAPGFAANAPSGEQLTEFEAAYLATLDYDNVEKIAQYLSETIGNSFTASFRKDMTVEYLVGLFESWGYEPALHEFDLSAPNAFGSNNANRQYNHGYVEIGGEKFMLYGPAFATSTVYRFTNNAVDAAGTAVLNWPTTGTTSQTYANLIVPEGADYTGKVVFVTVGTGPTQNAVAAVMPSAAQYHSASVALQEAGAAAVIYQWREPRATVISQFPPFNGELTVGDTSYSRITNMTDNTQINIPVGNTLWHETNEIIKSLGAGDNTPVRVDMRTRSDGTNVRAVYPSATGSDKNIYITSHFDTVIPAPGFNDSAIGVAMAMDMARAISQNNMKFEYNIVFLMFDAEEAGLAGARYYVSEMTNESRDNFVGLYNMDMIATGQPEAVYMFMNIPDPDIREIQRTLGPDDRLIENKEAFALAAKYDVFNHTYLAVKKLDNAGIHKDRKIVVDPEYRRYGDFIIKDHFNITWGSTTDNYAFAQPAATGMAGYWPDNMRNSMEFDWRILQRGLVGTTLAFTGMLETLYHKTGDNMEFNYNRCRLMVQGDVIFLGLFHSAKAIEPLALTTDAHLVKAGDEFTLNAAFTSKTSSNAAILTYTFNAGKFEYVGFAEAEGVTPLHYETSGGLTKITVMKQTYDIDNLGGLILRAREDAEITNDFETVYLNVEYALLGEQGAKEVKTAGASATFATFVMPESFNLIDLSNIIDWFGIDSTNPDWRTKYAFWDFNNSKDIEIYDIVFVAQRIR